MIVRLRLSVILILASAALAAAPWQAAHAVPSFARQTGFACGMCHTAYPALTPFGREFKLNGYTMGNKQPDFPPIAAMLQPSFTRTAEGQAGGASRWFGENNNVALSQASLFYGGRIYDKVGAFSQVTYSGVDKRVALDNTDIRFADHGTVGGDDLLYGLTLNNNPTVQDPWNTLPAWGYPFASTDLAPTPGAGTLIDGGFGGQVAGFGGYVRWNSMVYGEVTGYRTLSEGLQSSLGVSPMGEDQISGIAPYWRLAVEQTFGKSYLSVGTFGLSANTYPGRDSSMGTDHRTDLGIDAQYQYNLAPSDIGVYARAIHERADWSASQALGNTTNSHDTLNDYSLTGSYLYDATYGADLNFHAITGGNDAGLYGDSVRTGSPNSKSLTLQLDWLPFNKDGGPSAWKWFNPKFVAQYTKYFQFDGTSSNYDAAGRDAADNNTFFLTVWLPL